VTVFVTALVLIAWSLLTITPVLRLPFASLRAGLADGGRGGQERCGYCVVGPVAAGGKSKTE
jgi:hypothetical protein